MSILPVYPYVCAACAWYPWRPEDAQRHHRSGVMGDCEPWCGYWKLNPGSSGRTASVSTVELSICSAPKLLFLRH